MYLCFAYSKHRVFFICWTSRYVDSVSSCQPNQNNPQNKRLLYWFAWELHLSKLCCSQSARFRREDYEQEKQYREEFEVWAISKLYTYELDLYWWDLMFPMVSLYMENTPQKIG